MLRLLKTLKNYTHEKTINRRPISICIGYSIRSDISIHNFIHDDMKLEKAIELLEQHNKWRRGNSDEIEMVDVFELGKAIDIIVSEYKNNPTIK